MYLLMESQLISGIFHGPSILMMRNLIIMVIQTKLERLLE
ncbi:unknown protein [Cronobacter turicensis z3032]|uniref:Uncharacterized protein n=1 Tax=Cronobacter turicensis (strain DSM 18703 / CCUG 55852 / LMG 23827 / z3032) TaxID=693216 RepID=C9Y3I7_CROTZ|nr:unknown protein [Cronobacter turicensis z3032]